MTPLTTVKAEVPEPPVTAVPPSSKFPPVSKVHTLPLASVTEPPLVGVMNPVWVVGVGVVGIVVGVVGIVVGTLVGTIVVGAGVGVVGGVGVDELFAITL